MRVLVWLSLILSYLHYFLQLLHWIRLDDQPYGRVVLGVKRSLFGVGI